MNLEHINRRHSQEIDMYYRSNYGISSRLVKFENLILHVEVLLSRKRMRSYAAIAAEIAYLWQQANHELSNAIGCKIYFVDGYQNPIKSELFKSHISVNYDARKGILFQRNYLN